MKTAWLACVLACSCAAEERGLGSAPPRNVTTDDAVTARGYASWEQALLTDLAVADPRLALRLRIMPAADQAQRAILGALFAEEKSLRLVDGRADLFSFEERLRQLDALAVRASAPSRSLSAGAEGAFETSETELLTRILQEEHARAIEERRLPGSGSELLRGIVATWAVPADMAGLQERDAWLAGRLDELRGYFSEQAPMPEVEVLELDDALDPLEHLTEQSGFALAEAAIARLRVTLGKAQPTPSGGLGWDALSEGLAGHLGLRESEATWRSKLEGTESRLRVEAKASLSRLTEAEATGARRRAADLLLKEGVCDGRASRSPVRRAGPPPERALVCAMLGEISGAKTAAEDLAALLAMHDAVAVSLWAIAMHVDHRDAAEAPAKYGVLSEVPPEREGYIVRFAATRPIACMAVAAMADLLDKTGIDHRKARALRWVELGDAPIDLIEREFGAP